MNEKIRWGLLGTGAIARCLAENIPNSRTGVLHAVGSRTADAARQFADRHNVPNAHGSYDALLGDPGVDAVYVSTPHPMHAEWVIKAMRAGKHVLCEKPFALNAAVAGAMVAAAEQAGVLLMEAFMWRCHPQTAELVRLLRDKTIGDVKLIAASFGFKSTFDPKSRLWSNALAGGGIMDVGCYPVSAARLVAGAAVGRPFAHPSQTVGVAVLADTGVDRVAAATLRFDSGIVAQLSTTLDAAPENDLKIYGTDGWLHLPNPWQTDRTKPVAGKIIVHKSGDARTIDVPADKTSFAYEVDAFGDAARAGRTQAESPAMAWDDTMSQARTLDAWRAAAGVVYAVETPEGFPAVTAGGTTLAAGAAIPHGRIAGLDKSVSRLVLGCDNQRTFAGQAAICDAFFEAGGNAFDTGWIYAGGLQERLLGQWMKHRGVRDQCALIVKGAHTPMCYPDALGRQLKESLDRLQTGSADIYVMHRDNPNVPVGEFVDALDDHVAAGRVKIFGGSNWGIDRLQAANDYARANGRQGFAAVSNHFALARMTEAPWPGCLAASDDASREWFTRTQTAMLPWSSQAHGFFVPGRASPADTSNAMLVRSWYSPDNFERQRRANELADRHGVPATQIALAYVLAQPFPTFPLIGPREISELNNSLPALKLSLSEADVKWLDLRS